MSACSPCPVCEGERPYAFYEQRGVPVHSVRLFASAEEARACPNGELRLRACPDCSFIFNAAFDPGRLNYAPGYEPTQSHSPTFNRFHAQLANNLVETYGLRGQAALEIGCGQGEFLHLLCEAGMRRGMGFDPAYQPGPTHPAVSITPGLYHGQPLEEDPALVCCKMTLEHIADPRAFLRTLEPVTRLLPPPLLFFQVPDTTRILREHAFWDLYYEHCSYFTPGALRYLFEGAGYDVLNLGAVYKDQYLVVEARYAGHAETTPVGPPDVTGFQAAVDAQAEALGTRIRNGGRVVFWGSGSKAVALLNLLGVDDAVEAVVDVNPNRQGTFMAGTGHAIVAPETLEKLQPDVVLLMNTVYEREVRGQLAALHLSPELWMLS